jgi:hypothetical protein
MVEKTLRYTLCVCYVEGLYAPICLVTLSSAYALDNVTRHTAALTARSQPQGHSTAGRIMPIKNSSDTIGNRTRALPAYSTVPQPTAPPRTPNVDGKILK